MKIIIEEYSPEWPELFQKERELLFAALNNESVLIEHIGSTAVKDLGAKPVIDILLGLPDFAKAHEYIEPIASLGYQYISKFEDQMPFRRFFIKEKGATRTHHIHMVQWDTPFWRRHLAFRDYLRSNDAARDEYYVLKKRLSALDWKDGNEYAAAKSDFIKNIECKSRLTD